MKKINVLLLLCISLVILSFNSVTAKTLIIEKPNVKIDINGKLIKFPTVLITINGQPLLPYKELLTGLGVNNKNIIWNSKDNSIKASKNGIDVYMKIGAINASINSYTCTLEIAPVTYKGKPYVPVRFISQSFGKKVNWDGKSNKFSIVDQTKGDMVKSAVERADSVLRTSKYKVEMQESASESSGLSDQFDSNEKSQIDSVNKISYVCSKYFNSEGIEKVDELLVYKKTFYAKLSISDKWGKSELTNENFNWYLDTWDCTLMDSYLKGIDYSKLSIDNDIDPKQIVIQGIIRNDQDHADLGERETSIKIIIDKNTYQYKTLRIEATQIIDKTQKIYVDYSYSDFGGNFNVYIPEDLPK